MRKKDLEEYLAITRETSVFYDAHGNRLEGLVSPNLEIKKESEEVDRKVKEFEDEYIYGDPAKFRERP